MGGCRLSGLSTPWLQAVYTHAPILPPPSLLPPRRVSLRRCHDGLTFTLARRVSVRGGSLRGAESPVEGRMRRCGTAGAASGDKACIRSTRIDLSEHLRCNNTIIQAYTRHHDGHQQARYIDQPTPLMPVNVVAAIVPVLGASHLGGLD
jgi:hypothetical protein